MNNKVKITGLTLAVMSLSSLAFAAPSAQEIQGAIVQTNPGANINQLKDYFDKARVEQDIEEGKKAAASQIERQASQTETSESTVKTFKLAGLNIDESRVLTAEELDSIKTSYVGKDVSVNDLYAIVDKINTLYAIKGNFTCRAFLPQQKIEQGVVAVKLIEGTNGEALVTGNKHTRASYVKNRIAVARGEVPTLDKLNKDILRFNATNDAQLRIVMNKGKEFGTTDYELKLTEPQNSVVTVFTDLAGNRNTGIWRGGLFYNLRSLTGNRDNLSLGYVGSEGTKSGSFAYSTPVNRMGTKVNVGYSANSVHSIRHKDEYRTFGHASTYNIGISQPWVTTAKTRSEAFLEYSHQKSTSDFAFSGYRTKIVGDSTNEISLGFSLVNYGKSHLIYQRHSLIHGNVDYDIRSNYTTTDSYNVYKGDALYQKVYQHGQQLTSRASLQKGFKDNIPSSRAFYIGGMNTVRGYYENFMAADSGFTLNVEYQMPISKDYKTKAYVFADYGHLFGENTQSENVDRSLYSLGFGVKSSFAKNIYANLAFAFPLKRSFDGMSEDANRMRIHFILTGQF
ncbi:MAG: ShlB/FhaC/HecB family hemolysin secretion/activation protein [Phascolarctobacterium sp.]|nr:ShlB/FhaC/HecB family hemolysin secretion/activation protein [Phascolarctobacterium sp.]